MTTREQRLRELVRKWRNPKWEPSNENEDGWLEGVSYCADELAAILAEPVEVSEEMVLRAIAGFNGNGTAFMTLDRADLRAMHAALTAAIKETEQCPRCEACRSVGMLHCAHPEECGQMETKP